MTTRILVGDAYETLKTLPSASVHCIVTSPPYFGLRNYNVVNQIGLEPTPEAYVDALVAVFRQCRRVLRDDGTVFLNLGDSYGSNKQLLMIPARVALALQADGWILRSDIIWHKPNPMPESVTDRPTNAHEHIFLLAKSERYFYDAEAVREAAQYGRREWSNVDGNYRRAHNLKNVEAKKGLPSATVKGADPESGRNLRNVWTVATQPYSDAHFATFPPALIEPCIKAGTSEKGCCPHCSKPWARVTENGELTGQRINPGKGGHLSPQGYIRNGKSRCGDVTSMTLGWSPSCACPDHAPVPCTVLDPFGGAGTTGLVADRLGRNCILIELNPDYAALARHRIEMDGGLFASVIA